MEFTRYVALSGVRNPGRTRNGSRSWIGTNLLHPVGYILTHDTLNVLSKCYLLDHIVVLFLVLDDEIHNLGFVPQGIYNVDVSTHGAQANSEKISTILRLSPSDFSGKLTS